MEQSPSEVIMVRPAKFGSNPETMEDNAFQCPEEKGFDFQNLAVIEFDYAVCRLREAGVTVHVFQDTYHPAKPDAIFPNNWFSTHQSGDVILYPMLAKNRKTEKRDDIVEFLKSNYKVNLVHDYSNEERILEGTGSMVFDFPGKTVYACRSSRTNEDLLKNVSDLLGFEPIMFTARDKDKRLYYHTNVMMWIGTTVAAICLEAIEDEQEKASVLMNLAKRNLEIVDLNFKEIRAFAGNCLELKVPGQEKPLLAISARALYVLRLENMVKLDRHVDFIQCHINTIESIGGGGIRCMMAGIHLPKK